MIKSNQPSKVCQSSTKMNKYEFHWPQIQPVIRNLINNQPVNIEEWQNVFHHVHLICLWDSNGAFKLLKALEVELKERVIRVVKARLRSIEDGRQQLKEYVGAWQEYCQHCDRLPIAFQQLDLATRNASVKMRWPDKNHVATYPSKKINGSTVRTLMMKTWDRHITAPLEDRLRKSAIQLIMEDRQGLLVDTRLVVELRKSFNDLQFCTANNLPANTYLTSFEANYIESMVMFYQSRADEYYEHNGLIEYIDWAMSNIDQENKRARTYLSNEANAIQYVDETCSRILVANFSSHAVLECSEYINRVDLRNMQLIFKFLKRSTRESILDFLEEFRGAIIVNCLTHLISPEWLVASNCERFTKVAIELYNRFHSVVTLYLDNDPQACEALERAFVDVINDKRIFSTHETSSDAIASPGRCPSSTRPTIPPESRCADLLANYCDMLFRRTNVSKKLSSEDITSRLNQVLFIVRFLKNKETFLKFYRQHLIKRLILDISTDFAREQEFVSSLREVPEMPLEKITNLIRMFKDLKTSEDLYQKFRLSLQIDGNVSNNNNNEVLTSAMIQSNIENSNSIIPQENKYIALRKQTECLRVKVLNPCAWTKIIEEQSINLPMEVSAIAPEFELFYGQQYEGRRLIWCPQLSNGIISFTTTKGKYDLEVSAAQLSILSAFNDRSRKRINIIGLEKATGLSSVELRRNLWVSIGLKQRCRHPDFFIIFIYLD